MPFMEPEISNKITTSFEQVAACMYHGRRRVSNTLGLADHLIAKNKIILNINVSVLNVTTMGKNYSHFS